MNIRQAIFDTMELAYQNQLKQYPIADLSYDHLCSMHERIDLDHSMPEAKLCHWLGWMQAAIVSWGTCTLKDMKEINMRNAG